MIILLATLKSTMWWKVSKEEAAVECLVEGCHLAGIVSRVALLDESGYKDILQIITITINIVLMIHSIRGESSTTTTTRSVRSSTTRSGRRTRRPRRQRAGTGIVTIQQLFEKISWQQNSLPGLCNATGRFRQQPGMTAWCQVFPPFPLDLSAFM